MDPHHYTRAAMAGWVFTAVVLLSLAASDSPIWSQLRSEVGQQGEVNGTALLALLGALVGISAPPALGFLLERVLSAIFTIPGLRLTMWFYPCTEVFKNSLADALENKSDIRCPKSGGAVFHIFFYSYADPKLLEWARRRRTQMFASLTSALAIIAALMVAVLFLNAFNLVVASISVALAVVLAVHGTREAVIHGHAISAWVDTMGHDVIREFIDGLTSSGGPSKGTTSARHPTNTIGT